MPRTCDTSACGLGPDEWSKSDRLKSDRFLEELKKDPAFEWSKFDRFLVELEKDPLEEHCGWTSPDEVGVHNLASVLLRKNARPH